MAEQYWPEDFGETIAIGRINQGKVSLETPKNSTAIIDSDSIIFGIGTIPPVFSAMIVIRIMAGEYPDNLNEVSRCCIPFRALGKFAPGCGMRAVATEVERGWRIRLFGAKIRGRLMHICWHKPLHTV